ncbi:MAG: CHAT domain-containing protein [Methylacidiphilales bacterium]|nr:CHAT domain-containing protein [Candidatus Methylacidiphilales bacterium]
MPPTASSPANSIIIAQATERASEAEKRGDIPGLVQALNDEADALVKAHELDACEKARLRVLHLEEDHAGKNSLPVSDALLNLGWFYGNAARYEEAQSALDRCRDIRERLLGPDAAPVAEVLNALGALEENRGNLELAEAFYQQAIAIQEKAFGTQSAITANTWNNLATLYWIMGDYASAQKLFTQALAVREKTLGPDSPVLAKTLNNLALLDSSLGDYDEAEDYFQRALRIRTTQLGPDSPSTLTTLSQLGLLYVREGNDARAEPLLVRAVAMQEQISQPDDPDVARSLEELAMLYDRRKLYGKAEPLHLRALEIRRRILGDEHPEYAASLAALARHDHAQGKLADALPLYEQALTIDEDALGKNHPDTLAIAGDLAFLKIELRQPDDATRLAHDVAEAQQNRLNGVFAFAPERQRMDFARTIEPCDLPAALADADLLAETVLRTKGVVLDSLLEDEAVTRAERDPEVREMMEKRRLLLAQLGQKDEDVSSGDFSSSTAAPADRQQLEREEQQLEASLADKGVGSGETRRALATDVSEVEGALPPDAALVEYVAYNRYTGRLTSEPCYGAVVLTRSLPCQWVPLGSAAEIEGQVRLDQKYMRKRVHETTLAQVLHRLYGLLCQPVVAALPGGMHRLIISPDGDLNFISFATLLDTGDHFLADDFELNYVSSGRDLLEKPGLKPKVERLVVFANPDYNHLPNATTPGRSRSVVHDDDLLPQLPGTEREAAFLEQEAQRDGIDVQVYRGADASKANLAKLDSPYVLHLATHGLYLSEDDAPGVPGGSGDGAKTLAAEPMNRSLLALSGAAVTLRDWKKGIFPPPESDGLLTAQEAAGLNLDHTWLVALSACDTGGGEARAGEGVLGLRRGFAEAGAQNLLMTLWVADDTETADLMEAFYREALRSGDAPGALARVQRASLDELRKKSGLSEAVRKAGTFILSY